MSVGVVTNGKELTFDDPKPDPVLINVHAMMAFIHDALSKADLLRAASDWHRDAPDRTLPPSPTALQSLPFDSPPLPAPQFDPIDDLQWHATKWGGVVPVR